MSQNMGGHSPTNNALRSRVAAFLLINGLGSDPETDAQADGGNRRGLHVPVPQSGTVHLLRQHGRYIPSGAG